MKTHFFVLTLLCLLAFNANCQSKQPLYAKLVSIKNSSEYALYSLLKQQELNINTIPDSPARGKERQKLQDYSGNKRCVDAYYDLKTEVDIFISQLKADLTISNRKKLIKQLNNGTSSAGSWYQLSSSSIQQKHQNFLNCMTGNVALAASVEEITGIFTALAGVVTSARDFRAQQIKELCLQLDQLRLKNPDELAKGIPSSVEAEEDK